MKHFLFSLILLLHVSFITCQTRTTDVKSKFDRDLSKSLFNTQSGERHQSKSGDAGTAGSGVSENKPPPKPPTRQQPLLIDTCTSFWTIEDGNTCDGIASAFQLPLDALLAINPGVDCNLLVIGAQFCITAGVVGGPPPLPPPPPPPQGPPLSPFCTSFYTVQGGNTCDGIASAFQLALDALIAINPVLDCNALSVGAQVCITASCTYTWTVQEGHTCQMISDSFHVPLDVIIALNPGLDCNALIVGAQVCTG